MTALRFPRLPRLAPQARPTKPLTKPLKPARPAKPSARKRKSASPQAIEDPGAPKLLLSMIEAAYALSCGKSKLYDLIEAGEIVSFKVGYVRRVPVASLERYVARRMAESVPANPPQGVREA